MTLHEVYDNFIKKANLAGYSEDELVLGYGDENSKIVLVGEAPGKDEVRLKKPFVGKAGKNLDEFLRYTGIDRNELFITNTVKMRPYKVSAKGTRSNRPPNAAEKELCSECLKQELMVLSPDIVVTLGNTALKALAGKNAIIGDMHGKTTKIEKYTIFALYHPASIIYRRELTEVYYNDLIKLKEYIRSKY